MTDKSRPILSTDSVGREKLSVYHSKIGQFISADKSWPTTNIFVFENTTIERTKSRNLSGRCLLFEIFGLWNDAVTIKLIKVYDLLIDFYRIQVIQIIRTEFCPGLSNWVFCLMR